MTLSSFKNIADYAMSLTDNRKRLPDGQLPYSTVCVNFLLLDIKLAYGNLLSEHMTIHERQCWKVTTETFDLVKLDAQTAYKDRAEASQTIRRVSESRTGLLAKLSQEDNRAFYKNRREK